MLLSKCAVRDNKKLRFGKKIEAFWDIKQFKNQNLFN